MKYISIVIIILFSSFQIICQTGDNTAPLAIHQNGNGRIEVSFTSTLTRPNMTGVNFIINLPPNVTINNPTFYLNVSIVPGGGPTEYGHANFTNGPFEAGVAYTLMEFDWISTNPPGTLGDF